MKRDIPGFKPHPIKYYSGLKLHRM